jgi:Arc/MetJ family transcription regulator
MTAKMASVRIDPILVNEAMRFLGVKSRSEAVHVALKQIVGTKRFWSLMKKNAREQFLSEFK